MPKSIAWNLFNSKMSGRETERNKKKRGVKRQIKQKIATTHGSSGILSHSGLLGAVGPKVIQNFSLFIYFCTKKN